MLSRCKVAFSSISRRQNVENRGILLMCEIGCLVRHAQRQFRVPDFRIIRGSIKPRGSGSAIGVFRVGLRRLQKGINRVGLLTEPALRVRLQDLELTKV